MNDHVKVRHPGYKVSSFGMDLAMIEKAAYMGAGLQHFSTAFSL